MIFTKCSGPFKVFNPFFPEIINLALRVQAQNYYYSCFNPQIKPLRTKFNRKKKSPR